ncbi:hypothetical protein [Sporosarcina sp. FSL W7-1283]|uniref:hypothetical protein n=1 Tax=Sporosarcina sp. FSL W7-1283 TaxID=2921560 RepID=UPI0030FA6172
MINIQLTNREWYFLHVQVENIIKYSPDNRIAKGLIAKLGENYPSLGDVKKKFKMEYESTWDNGIK